MAGNYNDWENNLNGSIQQLENHVNELNGVLNECCRNLHGDMSDLFERHIRPVIAQVADEYSYSIEGLNDDSSTFKHLSSRIEEFYRVSSTVLGNKANEQFLPNNEDVSLFSKNPNALTSSQSSNAPSSQKQSSSINLESQSNLRSTADAKRTKISATIQPSIRNLQVDAIPLGKANPSVVDISEDMQMIRQRRLNTESMTAYGRMSGNKRDAAEFSISDSFNSKSSTRSFFE